MTENRGANSMTENRDGPELPHISSILVNSFFSITANVFASFSCCASASDKIWPTWIN
jgi:hypothetical protein